MAGLVANAQNPNAGVSVPEGHQTALATSWDIIDHDGKNVGYITSFGSTDNRPVTAVRHINSADAGRIVEAAPSPATKTLSATGFALYNTKDSRLIQRIGGSVTQKAMRTLEEQSIPFNIIEQVVHPATKQVVDQTVYHDCLLTSHSRPINIGTALVSETASIFVSWTGDE